MPGVAAELRSEGFALDSESDALTTGQAETDARWLRRLVDTGLRHCIANTRGELQLLGDWPVYVPPPDAGRRPEAYVLSPYVGWCVYGHGEIPALKLSPLRQRAAHAALHGAAALARGLALPQALVLDGWGLSTQAHAPALEQALPALLEACRQRWPGRSLSLRNVLADSPLARRAQALGAVLLPARVVHTYEGREAPWLRQSAYQNDRRLVRRQALQAQWLDSLPPALYGRVLQLYRDTYLHKHSPLNPDYLPAWLRCSEGSLRWLLLSDGQELLGFAAVHERPGLMTVPMLGHDSSRPRELGLYRQLAVHLYDHAAERALAFNFSSGAGHFKRQRGSVPSLEYTALWPRPWQAPLWRTMAATCQRLEARLLQTL